MFTNGHVGVEKDRRVGKGLPLFLNLYCTCSAAYLVLTLNKNVIHTESITSAPQYARLQVSI